MPNISVEEYMENMDKQTKMEAFDQMEHIQSIQQDIEDYQDEIESLEYDLRQAETNLEQLNLPEEIIEEIRLHVENS